jgi:hypothetical protein
VTKRGRATGSATCAVVDTNVLAVAEGMHPQASESCLLACITLVRRIGEGLPVVLDSGGDILREYIGTLRQSDRSGLGSKLVVALSRRAGDPTICRPVDITPADEPPGSYAEVPLGLRDFDPDDQKFIAAAVAEPSAPQISTAVDREWWDRRRDFVACGIDVQFLCADDFIAAKVA